MSPLCVILLSSLLLILFLHSCHHHLRQHLHHHLQYLSKHLCTLTASVICSMPSTAHFQTEWTVHYRWTQRTLETQRWPRRTPSCIRTSGLTFPGYPSRSSVVAMLVLSLQCKSTTLFGLATVLCPQVEPSSSMWSTQASMSPRGSLLLVSTGRYAGLKSKYIPSLTILLCLGPLIMTPHTLATLYIPGAVDRHLVTTNYRFRSLYTWTQLEHMKFNWSELVSCQVLLELLGYNIYLYWCSPFTDLPRVQHIIFMLHSNSNK